MTATTSAWDFVARHLDHGMRDSLTELRELLRNRDCEHHRDRFVSGHARAGCDACARHDAVYAIWQQRQGQLVDALLVFGDEYDGSGCAAESAICDLLHELARAGGIELEL
jgi:hypothetical protein